MSTESVDRNMCKYFVFGIKDQALVLKSLLITLPAICKDMHTFSPLDV